jgi:peptide deformylase
VDIKQEVSLKSHEDEEERTDHIMVWCNTTSSKKKKKKKRKKQPCVSIPDISSLEDANDSSE